MTSLSLQHVTRLPTSASRDPQTASVYPTILALHGRGSNEHDLIGLAPYLPQDFLWISPRGPITLASDSFEWFQVIQIGKPDPTRLANALKMLDTFIEEIISAYPIDKHKLYLLGFSQGSLMSMSYTLTRPQKIAGVVAQSGYIPHETGLQIDEAGIKNKPFILTHGIQDPLLSVDWARRSHDTLQKLGVNVEYHEFNMQHQINEESLNVVNDWLLKQL